MTDREGVSFARAELLGVLIVRVIELLEVDVMETAIIADGEGPFRGVADYLITAAAQLEWSRLQLGRAGAALRQVEQLGVVVFEGDEYRRMVRKLGEHAAHMRYVRVMLSASEMARELRVKLARYSGKVHA